MKRAQQSFLFAKVSLEHGGNTRVGKRKIIRPVVTKRPMHVVLRSSKAQGKWSFLTLSNQLYIEKIIFKLARKNFVKVMDYANVGNHLHLVVRAKTRVGFQNFLRTLTALIARKISGAKKTNPTGKFWDGLAYSRVVEWGKGLKTLLSYIEVNQLEALGWIDRDVYNRTRRVLFRGT